MFKSVLHELEQVAPELFQQVRTTVFRSWQVPPIVPDLVPRWMLHTGLAAVQTQESLYISSGAPESTSQSCRCASRRAPRHRSGRSCSARR